jgi:hypothetical protein
VEGIEDERMCDVWMVRERRAAWRRGNKEVVRVEIRERRGWIERRGSGGDGGREGGEGRSGAAETSRGMSGGARKEERMAARREGRDEMMEGRLKRAGGGLGGSGASRAGVSSSFARCGFRTRVVVRIGLERSRECGGAARKP